MAYINGVAPRRTSLLLRSIYRLSRRRMRKISGRSLSRTPAQIEILAHAPALLLGYGVFEQAIATRPRVDARLRSLAELKAAAAIGCEFCLDVGSQSARMSGVSEQQLRELHRYRESGCFDRIECLVLDLAAAMTRTPPNVELELIDALREHFDERQLVELTALIALENLRSRFNAAFGIGPTGYSSGALCARAEVAPPTAAYQGASTP